jgi:signal transduction histidine kinase
MLMVFAIIIYQSSKEAAFKKLDTNLKSYSLSLQSEIEDQLDDRGSINPERIKQIRPEGLDHTRYQLLNKRYEKMINDSLLSKHVSLENINLEKDQSFYKTTKLRSHHFRVLISKFETGNDSIYILETAASLHDAYEDLDRLFYLFVFLIPLGLIITGFSAYLLSRAAFRPITKIVNTAKNISGKNLGERVEVPKVKDEVRELAEALNEMIERLDISFKSQRRFVANASHEIRTPLTVIQTQLEVLKRDLTNVEDQEAVDESISEIEKLTKLTNSLLTIAKLDSSRSKLNMEQIRIDELLADCAQDLNKAAIARGIKINLSISDDTEILGDKEKLKSVFLNLIDNAIKYSNPNSTVIITMENIPNDKVKINVENTGRGIPNTEIPHIFNRFYRSNETRAEIGGSGLGLAIAKEIIELHKGEIMVKSKPDEVTIFTVILRTNQV